MERSLQALSQSKKKLKVNWIFFWTNTTSYYDQSPRYWSKALFFLKCPSHKFVIVQQHIIHYIGKTGPIICCGHKINSDSCLMVDKSAVKGRIAWLLINFYFATKKFEELIAEIDKRWFKRWVEKLFNVLFADSRHQLSLKLKINFMFISK